MPGQSDSWTRLRRMPLAWVSAAIILALVIIAIGGAVVFGGPDPLAISTEILRPPSLKEPFGTDELGRSVLLQIIIPARVSLAVGVSAALVASIIGIVVGAIAGYIGGVWDAALMRLSEIFQVMPTF